MPLKTRPWMNLFKIFVLYLFFIDTLSNQNPKCDFDSTPLHLAAAKGHFEVCKMIIENVDKKDLKTFHRFTPLHVAALMGHLEIYELILSNIEEKSPIDINGNTPLDFSKVPYKQERSQIFLRIMFHPPKFFSCSHQKIPPCSFINLV